MGDAALQRDSSSNHKRNEFIGVPEVFTLSWLHIRCVEEHSPFSGRRRPVLAGQKTKELWAIFNLEQSSKLELLGSA